MTHEEIEAYGYGNEIIFKNLEEKIMADIVRKIKTAGDLSGSTVYLMEQLSYMGYDIDSIKKMIQEALEESEEYVDKLYDDVLQHEYLGASPIFQAKEVPMIPFKQNPVMQNLLSFAKSSTNGEMKNMTQSLGFVKKTIDGTKAVELSKFYQETMDKALMEVATGTFSLDRALNDAVNVMVNSGVRWIDYESGHHNRIAVAARRSVMSGLANASQEQTKNMAKELDIHTFEVSAHMGARPTHAVWQGKVYTEEELVSVCGLGEVTGLLGANCYHNYYMFFEGVSKRTYTDEELERWKDDTPTKYEGKEYTNYEARQRMRQMETNMRAQKEKIKLLEKGGASKEVIQSAQARYRKQMSEYERFADAMNMKTQKNRITIGDGKTMKGVEFKQEAHLSELGKFRNKHSDISVTDNEYYRMLQEKFSHGSREAKKAYNKYVNGDTIADSEYYDVPRFDTKTGKIFINFRTDYNDERGSCTAWFHEHGHYIDWFAGNPSSKYESYYDALIKDYLDCCHKHKYNYSEISEELLDPTKSAISDLYDAISQGEVRGSYVHSREYWDGSKALEIEAFAHMFEAQFDNVRLKHMRDYFPTALKEFENILRRL